MRLLGFVVGKNECSRMLQASLAWNTPMLDATFFFDDQSTDETRKIAMHYVDKIAVRQDGTPSFMEHEGHFKQAAWNKFEESMFPELGDWILTFDCDEFLCASEKQLHPENSLKNVLAAIPKDFTSFVLRLPEIWDTSGMPLLERVDGFWGQNFVPRLFKYVENAKFSEKAMGCLSAPEQSYRKQFSAVSVVNLLHFGYSMPGEVEKKYKRYSSLQDHGHNPAHIQSIVATPTLREYTGSVPKFWTGIRN